MISPPRVTFKKLIYLNLSFLFIVLLLIISCRKIDDISLRQEPFVNPETRFFTEHAPTDALVKSVLGFVKRENEKHRFVSNLINKIGYPYWNKSIAINKSGAATRTLADSTNTVFIPFVMESENTVNTTLVVNTSPFDTNFHFIADWQYRNYTYGQPAADTTAENVALLFMLLDRNVFGYEKFIITDSNLFRTAPWQPDLNDREIRISSPNNGRISTSYLVTVCNNTYRCGTPYWCLSKEDVII